MGSLVDDIRKIYRVNYKCKNCGAYGEVVIPKGVAVEVYFKSNQSKCGNCGCTALERYDGQLTQFPFIEPLPECECEKSTIGFSPVKKHKRITRK